MILPSHYALLSEAADAVALNGIIGEPTKERKSRSRARPRDERGRFVKQDADAAERRVESVPIARAESDIDETYREVFAELSTAKMEELLTGTNERLDQLLELVADWWKWDKRQLQTLRSETRKRQRLEDLEQQHNRQQDQIQKSGGTGSGHPLDPMFDEMFGNGDIGDRRKRNTRTRRTPRRRPGLFKRMGGKVMSGLSTVGRVGALAATGALGYMGLSKVVEHAPEPPRVELDPPETRTPDVRRTAAEAADVPEVRNAGRAADAARAEKGIFSKLGGIGKIGGALGGLLTAGLVANEALDIKNNDTLTDSEKNREFSKLGGNATGSVIGGAGGAWVGAQGGAAAGALIGSVVPVLGTAVGAAVGTAVGAVLGGGVGSFFGSDVGESAGSMVYDIVVRDDQVKKDDDEHKVQAELKSPDLEKIAKATESPTGGSWWQRLLGIGGAAPTVGNYAQGGGGGGGFLSSFGYGGNRGNVVPRAGFPSQKLDYRTDPNYVVGQGVLKQLPTSNNQEAQLSRWSSLIEEKAAARGVDPLLVRSVMKQESGGKADARSPTGVEGLMQLTRMTAAEVGVRDRRDPAQSIDGGAAYLAKQIKAFGGNVPLALAAYNGGAGNINKAIKHAGSNDPEKVLASLPYVMNDQAKVREIQGYVQNITRYHKEYQDQAKAIAPTEKPSTVDVTRESASGTAPVARSNTSDNIITQTTPPPPAAIAAPAAPQKGKGARTRTDGQGSRRAEAPPAAIAQAGGQDPTSLDDMPLLLTDHGLGGILLGRI